MKAHLVVVVVILCCNVYTLQEELPRDGYVQKFVEDLRFAEKT